MEYDEILKRYLGELGRYQILMILLCGGYQVTLLPVWCEYSYVAWQHSFECDIEFNHMALGNYGNRTSIETADDQCSYVVTSLVNNVTLSGQNDSTEVSSTQDIAMNGDRLLCKHWTYDTSVFKSTLVTEWDLVCDKEYLPVIAQTVFLCGTLVQVLSGPLPDKFGRKPIVCIFAAFGIASHFVMIFSYNVIMFLTFAFLTGFNFSVSKISLFTMASEVMGTRHRPLMASTLVYAWALGKSRSSQAINLYAPRKAPGLVV